MANSVQKIFKKQWVTPLMIAVAVIPMISGSAMFFGYLKGTPVKVIHEWVGISMVVIVIAHLLSHWATFKHYLKGKRVWLMSAIFVILIPAYFFVSASQNEGEGGGGPRQFINILSQADITTFAELSGKNAENLAQKLQDANIVVADPTETIADIAKNNQKNPFELMGMLAAE